MSNGNQVIQAPNCEPPGRTRIGNNPRELTWVNPGGAVLLVTITGGPDPDTFFTDGRQVGPNYQLKYNGSAPSDSVWPYTIQCQGDTSSAPHATGDGAATQPELTNGF